MRQARFTLYFALGFFLVTLLSILVLMLQVAPGRSNVPFMGMAIDPGPSAPIVYLPNRIFDCTNQNQQFRCEATLKDQTLQITFDQGKDYIYNLKNCRATYAAKAIDCQQGIGGNMTNRGILAYYVLNSDLGLTVAQLQAIQQQYWVTNLIGTGSEGFAFFTSLGMAAIGAILAIGLNWLDDNWLTRSFTSLSSGFSLALFVYYWMGGVPFTTLAQYGIADTTWSSAIPIVTIAVGTLVSILTGLYVSRHTNHSAKGMVSLLFGAALAFLIWYVTPFIVFWIPDGFVLRPLFTLGIGISTVILFWKNNPRSIKFFSCGISALGAFVMLLFWIYSLAGNLGYPD